jgi:hypothetical protein
MDLTQDECDVIICEHEEPMLLQTGYRGIQSES